MRTAVLSATLAATAAIAQAPPPRPQPNGDPDQILCINERVTGSRVATQRVCRTRREWDEHKGETRKVVERVQYLKPTF